MSSSVRFAKSVAAVLTFLLAAVLVVLVAAQANGHLTIARETVDPTDPTHDPKDLEAWYAVADWAQEVADRHGRELVIVNRTTADSQTSATLGTSSATLAGGYFSVPHARFLAPVLDAVVPVDVLQLSLPVESAQYVSRFPELVELIVTHEAMHALAYEQCGTTRIGDPGRHEAVTDAATALTLDLPGDVSLPYAPAAPDYTAARILLAGGCP